MVRFFLAMFWFDFGWGLWLRVLVWFLGRVMVRDVVILG